MRLSDAPQLSNQLLLKFNLSDEYSKGVQVIAIPSSLLKPNGNFGITVSKINAWPVLTYARIYPEYATTYDKVSPIITELLQTDKFFQSSLDCDRTGQSESYQCGLDVEKLSFTVGEKRQPDIGENYWLVIGLKRSDSEIISRGKESQADRIYENFGINLGIEMRPFSLIPLLTVLLMTLIVYCGFLRKYHLRIFALK